MINFPALGANSAGAILKLVFREAKIHDGTHTQGLNHLGLALRSDWSSVLGR